MNNSTNRLLLALSFCSVISNATFASEPVNPDAASALCAPRRGFVFQFPICDRSSRIGGSRGASADLFFEVPGGESLRRWDLRIQTSCDDRAELAVYVNGHEVDVCGSGRGILTAAGLGPITSVYIVPKDRRGGLGRSAGEVELREIEVRGDRAEVSTTVCREPVVLADQAYASPLVIGGCLGERPTLNVHVRDSNSGWRLIALVDDDAGGSHGASLYVEADGRRISGPLDVRERGTIIEICGYGSVDSIRLVPANTRGDRTGRDGDEVRVHHVLVLAESGGPRDRWDLRPGQVHDRPASPKELGRVIEPDQVRKPIKIAGPTPSKPVNVAESKPVVIADADRKPGMKRDNFEGSKH